MLLKNPWVKEEVSREINYVVSYNWMKMKIQHENLWDTAKVGLRGGEGNGNPLQYSCLENPMDGGAWWAAVHGVAKSRTWLCDFTFTFHFHALEKEMAAHSSVLAWRIPGMGEPGGLPSVGLHRVGHDWSALAAAAAMLSGKFIAVSEYTRKEEKPHVKDVSSHHNNLEREW